MQVMLAATDPMKLTYKGHLTSRSYGARAHAANEPTELHSLDHAGVPAEDAGLAFAVEADANAPAIDFRDDPESRAGRGWPGGKCAYDEVRHH